MSRSFQQKWPDLSLRVGVIAFRPTADARTNLLLIRRPHRHFWSIPKGQLMPGLDLHEAAAVEAAEEAGIAGKVCPVALGSYRHVKVSRNVGAGRELVEVALFGLEVETVSLTWPEMHLRERRWVRPDEAAHLVASTELSDFLGSFEPRKLMEMQ